MDALMAFLSNYFTDHTITRLVVLVRLHAEVKKNNNNKIWTGSFSHWPQIWSVIWLEMLCIPMLGRWLRQLTVEQPVKSNEDVNLWKFRFCFFFFVNVQLQSSVFTFPAAWHEWNFRLSFSCRTFWRQITLFKWKACLFRFVLLFVCCLTLSQRKRNLYRLIGHPMADVRNALEQCEKKIQRRMTRVQQKTSDYKPAALMRYTFFVLRIALSTRA